MAVVEFPAASFTVEGDPAAIRESGLGYSRFATVTGEAAGDIRALDSGSWVGSEGEEYRSKVAAIPPPLDVAHGAFGEVAVALGGFADTVESAQRRMTGIRSDAKSLHSQLATASADRDGMKPPDDQAKSADPTAQDTYDTARTAADSKVSGIQAQWDDQVSAAGTVRAQVREAAAQAAARVQAAGRRSPTADQNWFSSHWEAAGHWIDDNFASLRTWIGEHADILRFIAGAMKIVGIALMAFAAVVAGLSFVVGLFTGVGFLGEIPAGAIFLVGSLLYGGGEALDTAVDWGEGKIDGSQLLLRVGTSLLFAVVGGAALKLGGKAVLKLLEKTGLDKKIAHVLESLASRFRRDHGPAPTVRETAPGARRPGTGEQNPLEPAPPTYTVHNPAIARRGEPKPTDDDLASVGQAKDYAPGSEEHMWARWNQYLQSTTTGDKWSWERWRDQYVRNIGNEPQGTAYEKAFRDAQHLDANDGWVVPDTPQTYPGDITRRYDVVNPEAKVAYEIKSGDSVDWAQVAKDAKMVQDNGWQVVYVFGKDVPPSLVKKLEDMGITVNQWTSSPVQVP